MGFNELEYVCNTFCPNFSCELCGMIYPKSFYLNDKKISFQIFDFNLPLTNFIFTDNFYNGNLINQYKQLLCNMISTKNDITDAYDYFIALGKIDSYYCSHEQKDSSKLFLTHIKGLSFFSRPEASASVRP